MNRFLKLDDLLNAIGLGGRWAWGKKISGLAYDSRALQPGDLFFAVRGVHADGHLFLKEAAAKGAVAAVVERAQSNPFQPLPQIVVPSVSAAMSKISACFFGEPSKHMPVIGVTGTNGKTTFTYLIEDLLSTAGLSCGVMGTVNYRIGGDVRPAPNTTPMSLDVQKFLADLVEKPVDVGVMEVSSHALAQYRVEDVDYKVGVFTNLTQDHLDYHKTMESYFSAKASLFRKRPGMAAAINIDDPYGARLAGEMPQAVTFGTGRGARLRASGPTSDLRGIHFQLSFPNGHSYEISNNLIGHHNISNSLAAAAALWAFGRPEKEIVAGLNAPHNVPGRLERVDQGQDFLVLVDYAHTHDAMAQVLSALRSTGPKKLICVFGAGGDRDRTKRPKMGRVAVELADEAIITSDNPRSEDPIDIMRDIERGIKEAGKSNYTLCVDRQEAIDRAIKGAGPGTIILIAGKGHETYQIYKDRKVHFSDVEAAKDALKRR